MFRFRNIVVGGYYLPPSLDLTICRESFLIGTEYAEDQTRNMFLVGDLNMRMGPRTGDSSTNFRSRLWYTIEEMGFCWVQPDEGKWTVDTTRGDTSLTTCLRTHKHGDRLKALRSGRLNGLRAQTTV